jgi:ubiquinol-cytochrome c reductase cytochrome c subunit
MNGKLFLAAIALAALASGWASSALAADAANGKQLFMADGCYMCHGTVGQGGSSGPRLAPKPIPFEAFSMQLRHPSNQMPPYTPVVVPDAALADLYAYLQSIPASPALADIPLLKN